MLKNLVDEEKKKDKGQKRMALEKWKRLCNIY